MTSIKTKPQPEPRKCFIITPIGNDNSDTRRRTDGLIRSVIVPVLDELGIQGEAAHQIDITGSISKKIIQRIVEDDIVIANLTELNPNVMYELAVRHATRKPIVIVAEFGTSLPFDIVQQNTLFYTNDMLGADTLKPKLKAAIELALTQDKPDNPIYDGIEDSIMRKEAIAKGTDTEKYILDKLDSMSRQIVSLSRSVPERDEYSSSFSNRQPVGKLTLKVKGKVDNIREILVRCMSEFPSAISHGFSIDSIYNTSNMHSVEILLVNAANRDVVLEILTVNGLKMEEIIYEALF